MPEPIAPGERRELRALVRSQLKVLRAEVKMREAELVAQGEERIRQRYASVDKAIDDLNWRLGEVAKAAQREADDAIKASGLEDLGGRWRGGRPGQISCAGVERRTEDKGALHNAFIAGIRAQIQTALLQLDRQEADLLRELAMESLETSRALEFVARIPTVGELVPSSRLREIEAEFYREATS